MAPATPVGAQTTVGGQAEQGGGASPNLPPCFQGKKRQASPTGQHAPLRISFLPLPTLRRIPFCFRLHGNLYSPASPGEGSRQRQEGQRPPLNPHEGGGSCTLILVETRNEGKNTARKLPLR